jgi:hypothetical protein
VTEILYSRNDNPDLTSGPAQPRLATLMSMCQEILGRLGTLAVGRGIILPVRQFIYMTAVPVDCEQVAVMFGGWVGDPPAGGMTSCFNFRWCAQIGVALARCTPAVPPRGSTSAPPVDKMNAAAQIASDDAELLIELVSTFGEVGADLTLSTPEPEGGYQAVLLTCTLPAFGGLD